jgi:two-component system, NtrC family, response regulator
MGRIVVVDDDPQYADLLKQLLSASGHEVFCCGTLHDGHEAVDAVVPEIVLLDVCLPDGSGLDQIHAIKAASCLPEIIVITASGDQDGAEVAVRAGVWGYWQKGRSLAELMLNVAQAIAYRADRMSRRDWRSLDLGGLLGESRLMVACFEAIAEASAGEAPVLICGETGTGKERVAKAVHDNSPRADRPFIVVDCASLTDTLVESLLLGHERGAFTGASADRIGLVRQAHGGTLFLDEIGELALGVQKSFLRVLQEKRFRPVGSDREVSSDFRLVAATNRNLQQMVDAGDFREDLYFRLRSMEIALPPLRTRGHDIVKIAEAVSASTCERMGLPEKTLGEQFGNALLGYPWPGNVRELQHAVECAVASAGNARTIDAVHLPIQIRVHLARSSVRPELNHAPMRSNTDERPTLAQVRDSAGAAYLAELLEKVHGDVEAACQIADVSRSRLYGLLKMYGIGRTSRLKATRSPVMAGLGCDAS